MRILTVHADFIEFEPLKKAGKFAEEITPGKRRFEECLVVFMAVEKGDEQIEASAKLGADEIVKVCEQVKTKAIVLYPLVHLTSNPSSIDVAQKVLFETQKILAHAGYKTEHAPFGWYKSYDLKCKGHPLSELSRELHASGKEEAKTGEKGKETTEKTEKIIVSESLKKESEMKSKFYVLTPSGELVEQEKFKYGDHKDLKKFVDYEVKKVRSYSSEPPHIKLMKEHSLLDYEPGSDSGNFRWYPKGRLMKKLLENAITNMCISYGAVEVETPIMYDYQHPALKKYLNRFPARQYVVESDDKNFFLRFSACFGQFLIAHDAVISYKILPLKMFELTKYSFRREQSGELAGLKRLRAFTMPDMHTLCSSVDSAKTEFESQFKKSMEWMDMVQLTYEAGFRVQRSFFDENRKWYESLVKKLGKPIMLELFEERYAYFITKFEFNYVDNLDKASALSTVQIDVENSETFDINYVNDTGSKVRPTILHASFSGSIERVIYALLEKEAMKIKQGKKAMFPVWLSPTQIRIIPISDAHTDKCLGLAAELGKFRCRVDVDDRQETLQKRIRDAELEWIPFTAVVGDREAESGKLAVTIRSTGEKKQFSVEELSKLVEKENAGKPFEPLSLPQKLSKRPII
ncbi:Threonine--tRNA ligase [Candidatus Gugararchaeum adminiculabundum]|nr:Threonine--tRNA ligase [Candidatus Gugararchaeum adminiculabundum]